MSNPLWYTLRMIMNDTKTYEATYYTSEQPQEYPNGKVTLKLGCGEVIYHIMNWHTHSDISNDLETVQVWNPITKRLFEIYSTDEGETFTFDLQEG